MPPQRHDLTATGPSTASDPARLLNPKRTTDVLPKPDNCKSYRQVIKDAAAVAAGLAAPALLHIRSAYAAYPDRPIKVVVANTPGGPVRFGRPHDHRRTSAIDR